ncbi:MAG: type I polyketide synthase [Anaerolineales bacterium]|nr:type I polyketide synthase [Anaerolineales bacterium]
MTDAAFAGALANLPPEKRALLAAILQPLPEPLAVIGLACRFPGGANTPEQFWHNLLAGHDAITAVPADRWPVADADSLDPAVPGQANSRYGGFVDQVDQFDAAFFGIAPREALRMDPQQRLFLEVAWEALERAGQTLDNLAGSAAGVYAAVYQGDYASLQLADAAAIDSYVASGMSHAILANRLSHFLDVRGPSLAVDTACSSSLVALHLAAQALRQKEIDLALVGGVNLMLSPLTALSVARWGAIAPDGRIKAFDAGADGIVRGEGCGVLVLKRLSEARRAGDPILALYRGSAVNQDGRTNVLTAPNGLAQQQVLAEALRHAGLRPAQVGYIEAHGTGTPLGDPIEMEALLAVYGAAPRAEGNGRAPLWVGSVKTNLGHLEAAAGMAGIIKTVLTLQHGVIPPHLHFNRLNPHISLGDAALAFPLAAQPWAGAGDEPRRAAVSSFGFGGTNAHVLLEAAPPPDPLPAAPATDAPVVLTLSAPQAEALPAQARAYRAMLDEPRTAPLPALAASAAIRRTHFSHRLAVAGRTAADLVVALEAYLAQTPHPALALGRRLARAAAGSVFVFSGQGAQWEGMARGLYSLYPAFRAALDECAAAFGPHLSLSLTDLLLGRAPGSLADTALGQPAIFAVQAALAAQWAAWGVRPAAVVGHSLGEVAAAYVAGALTLAEAAQVVAERSRLMQTLTGQGKMAAVSLSPEALLPRLARHPALSLAAFNAPASCVVSGEPEALRACLAELQAAGARVQPLPVDYAFHSPQVQPLVAPLTQALAGLRPRSGRVPFTSTVTGARLPGDQLDAAYWGRNLAEPVRFAPAVAGLIAEGYGVFLEVAPHPTLSQYVQQLLEHADQPGVAAHSTQRGRDEALTLTANLGRLYAHGLQLDWSAVLGSYPPVALPTYPWQHRRYWFQPTAAPAAPVAGGAGPHPLLDRRVHSPVLPGPVFESVFTAQRPAYQGEHRLHDVLVVPAAAYIEMAAAAGRLLFGDGAYTVRGLVIRDALVVPPDGRVTVQLALAVADPGRPVDFQIFAAWGDTPDEWRVYARGQLTPTAPLSAPAFDPATVQARCGEPLDGPAYYQLGRDYGGALGPRFQSIQRLWRRAGEVLGQLAAGPALAPELAGYMVHPAYLDAAFHIAYAAQADDLAATGLLMPIAFDEVTVYGAAASSGWCHFELRGEGEHGLVVGDARLYNPDGALVVAAHGVRYLRAAGAEALLRHARAPVPEAVYRLAWQPQPLPAVAAPSAPPGAGWLLLADEGGLAEAVAAALRAAGQAVALAQAGQTFTAGPDSAITYDPADPEHYRRLLSSDWACAVSGPLHLVDLRPVATLQAEPPTVEALLPQLRLVQAALAQTIPVKLWFVTRRAQPAGPEPLAPAGSLVWGLGRTLALEHAALFGGLIDLDDHVPEAAAPLAAELLLSDGEPQVAWRGEQRYLARLLKAPAVSGNPPAIRPEAAYLVTGATGGIGRALARWLVEQGARHLLLISRRGSAPELEPEWAALRDLGAQVHLAAADVADAAALTCALAAPGLPPLAGVFHAAGVVADAALLHMTPAQLAAVMAAKVPGAWNLHLLTSGLSLDHFVLFSSAAAVLGSPGQGNYAAANAYLDALAHARRAQGLPALSVNWGPWQTGMATAVGDKGRRRWEAWGLEPLSAEQGLARLARVLGRPEAQLAVLNLRWPPPTPQALTHVLGAPLFRELARGLPAAPQQAAAAPKLRQELAGLPPRRQKQMLVDYLGQQIAALLGWEAGHAIDPQQGFFDLGLDSLTAVELKERLDTALQLPQSLPATVAFDYPNSDRLAAYLLEQVAPLNLPAAAAPEPRPAPADDLDQLDEAELAALLAEELRQIDEGKA